MAQSGRTIRVYVSSTFRDMHAERDYLHKIVFPALRERMTARNLNLVVVDPRCNVSEDKADIELAFKEIEQSTIFIGILGECYGIIPDKIPENALIQYPWLKNYSGLSVTALEILHALHTSNYSVRCSFCFRDPQIVSEIPEVVRADYVAKDHEEAIKLKELKDKIRASGSPTLENYPCQWDDQKRCLVGLKTFGESVLNALWQAIDKLYRNIEVGNVSLVHNIEFGVKEKQSKQPLYLDENVQFTVYRPKKIQPLKWYPLLTFAHLSERPLDAKEDEPDPIEEVQKQAKQILGEQVDNYADLTHDSRQAVPRQGEITLVPQVPGIEFNPPSRSFLWTETVHKEEFRIRASLQLDGKMAEGRISVFLSGSIVLAEIGLRIKVDSHEQYKTSSIPYEHISSRAYRRIFASYSRKDLEIVEEFEKYAHAVGDEYLRDLVHIRTGEVWDERLIQMISQADIFQLFWSWNSIRSKFVEREWKYALSLKRSQFVRPVYWEDPLPELKEENLPPEELQKLHFQRLPIKTTSVEYSQRQGKTRTTEKSANQVRKKDTSTIRHKKYHVPEPQTLKKIKPTKRKVFRYPTIICLVMFFVAGFIIGIPIYKNYSDKRVQSSVDGKNTIASKEESKKLLQTQSVPQELQDETKSDIKNGGKKKISPINLAETDKQSNVKEDKNKEDTATKTEQKPMKVASKDFMNSNQWKQNYSSSGRNLNVPSDFGKMRNFSNNTNGFGNNREELISLLASKEESKKLLQTQSVPQELQDETKSDIKNGGKKNISPINLAETDKQSNVKEDKNKVDIATKTKQKPMKVASKDLNNSDKWTNWCNHNSLKPDEALKLFKEQELICRKQGNKDVLQSLLGDQALVLIELGELDKALELLREKEHICREFGNNKELVSSLLNQVVILSQRMNCFREALPLAEEAYKLAGKEGLIEQTQQIKRIINSIKNEK